MAVLKSRLQMLGGAMFVKDDKTSHKAPNEHIFNKGSIKRDELLDAWRRFMDKPRSTWSPCDSMRLDCILTGGNCGLCRGKWHAQRHRRRGLRPASSTLCVIHRGIDQLQGDDIGHIGRPCQVSPALPFPELL